MALIQKNTARFEFDSVSEMQAAAKSGFRDDQIAYLKGILTTNNNGSGNFRYDASSSASDDGATVIEPTGIGNGRFLKVWESSISIIIYTNTTTSYTLAISDAGGIVEMNNASANTVTIPPNSNVAFPVGTRIDITQYGAGATSLVAGSGVTIRGKLNVVTQYSGITLYKRDTNEWVATGGTT